MNRMKKSFFEGRKAVDLEAVIQTIIKELRDNKKEQDELAAILSSLEYNFGFAVQKTGLVRFNPFTDGGGNFSFTLALLDGHNSGVVITSMHGREQNRIYSKRIARGASEIQLTEEEQQALILADKKHKERNHEELILN